jgi:transcriptional regulator with XRE-family HTH domain
MLVPAQERWVDQVALGTRIRNARTAHGMSESELARGLTSVAYLSRIEANERRPSPELLASLCDRLRLNPSQLTRGETPAADGLRFELAHADFLYASGHFSEAVQVARDLAEVAQGIGSDQVARAARVVQSSALRAQGHAEAAVRILQRRSFGPLSLPAMVALARCQLELSDCRGALAVGQQAIQRISPSHRLSAPEGAELALTLCTAFARIGRPGMASYVARLALSYLPASSDVQDVDLAEVGARSVASSRPQLEKLVRGIERKVAAHQLAKLRADREQLASYAALVVVSAAGSRERFDRFVVAGELP